VKRMDGNLLVPWRYQIVLVCAANVLLVPTVQHRYSTVIPCLVSSLSAVSLVVSRTVFVRTASLGDCCLNSTTYG
jgi:hypothetical protein